MTSPTRNLNFMALTVIKYTLIRILLLFGFFISVWSGLNWTNLVVRNLEQILQFGHDPGRLLQHLLYTLIIAVDRIFPFVVFLTSIFFAFRLQSNNELHGMQAIGMRNALAVMPFVVFALLMFAADVYLKFELRPLSQVQIQKLANSVEDEITVHDHQTGKFLVFPNNVTLFVERTSEDGTLNDIFVHMNDTMNDNVSITFLAEQGTIEYTDQESRELPIITLNQGRIYTYNSATKQNYKLVFNDDLEISLNPLTSSPPAQELPRGLLAALRELLNSTDGPQERATFLQNFNDKAAKVLFTFLVALLGGVTVVYGTSQRWNIWVSVGCATILAFGSFFLGEFVEESDQVRMLSYSTYYVSSLPMLLGILLMPGYAIFKHTHTSRARR